MHLLSQEAVTSSTVPKVPLIHSLRYSPTILVSVSYGVSVGAHTTSRGGSYLSGLYLCLIRSGLYVGINIFSSHSSPRPPLAQNLPGETSLGMGDWGGAGRVRPQTTRPGFCQIQNSPTMQKAAAKASTQESLQGRP